MKRFLQPRGIRYRGFTLIELLITVVILAILVAVALPSYQDSVRKARRGDAKADLVELAQGYERYFTTDPVLGYAGWVLPFNQSPRTGQGFYTITTVAGRTTFTLTATPTGVQAADRCGVLTLNEQGVKTHSLGTRAECW